MDTNTNMMREQVQLKRTALYLRSMPTWKDRTKVILGSIGIGAILAILVYHYHYLNSIINALWQGYKYRLFKRCANCKPYPYYFVWQSMPSLILQLSNGKNRLLGRSSGQPLTSTHSSWFFHRCCELGMLAGFSIPDVRSPSTQRKFNPKGFHQESRSVFHNMPAKPLRLESSSKLYSPWILFFFFFFLNFLSQLTYR